MVVLGHFGQAKEVAANTLAHGGLLAVFDMTKSRLVL
jgi:hypothetical protein